MKRSFYSDKDLSIFSREVLSMQFMAKFGACQASKNSSESVSSGGGGESCCCLKMRVA